MEVWKDIKDYEGLYQVSNLGKVKSLARVVAMKNGVKRPIRERIRKQHLSKKMGYYKVNLHKSKKIETKQTHVLVAIAFLGYIPDRGYTIAHHINEIRTDNRADNLRVMSRREHQSHHATNSSTGEHNITRIRNGKFKVDFWLSPANRIVYIGTYETIGEAIIVRDKTRAEIAAGTFVPKPKKHPAEKQSKYCCVTWHKTKHKWQATVKGKYLGTFITEEEAHQAVLKHEERIRKINRAYVEQKG